MDSKFKEIISQNLVKLVELTVCDTLFLTRFESSKVLSPIEVESIRVAGNGGGGRYEMSRKFYDIIQTKSGSFPVLLEALRDSNKTGALKILQLSPNQSLSKRAHPGVDHPKTKSSKFVRFSKCPDYITNFQKAPSPAVLIVNSNECQITCDKICETASTCQYFSAEKFLEELSLPDTAINSNTNVFNPVVNCENKDIPRMLSYIQHLPGKFILVGNCNNETNSSRYQMVSDSFEWNGLTPMFRENILEKIKYDFDLDSADCLMELENTNSETILQLIKCHTPTLFKDTIPDLIKYYIPRRLITRNIISPTVFSREGPDIFLIQGIQRNELTEIAGGKQTTTSSEFISSGFPASTKFVLLREDRHYEKISESVDVPVHVFKVDGEKIIWQKSSGDIHAAQYNVSKGQMVLNEDEFLQNVIDESHPRKHPIVISDTPGMGKSILLTKIGKQLKQKFPDDLIAFMVISELVEQAKDCANDTNFADNVFATVAKNICCNSIGEAYLRQNKQQLKHLLLDGFDEISVYDIPLANRLLKELREIFSSTTIWITTRPHLFTELEKSLNVLGYNIASFEEEDQVNFFQSFWSSEKPHLKTTEKLVTFAKNCLCSIKTKINSDNGQDIAGIPLQCLLIGEVFQEDALAYCEGTNDTTPDFDIKSISDLYRRLVKKKFETFFARYDKSDQDSSYLVRAHTYFSLWLLFPNYRDKFKSDLKTQSPSVQEIFDVGILESKSVVPTPRFIHRTFAEYFVALFLVESLSNNWSKKKEALLFNNVLRTKSVLLKVGETKVDTQEFIHNVICYFIDSFMHEQNINISASVGKSVKGKKLRQISEACASGCLSEMMLRLVYPISDKQNNSEIFTEKLLIVSTLRSDLNTVKENYERFKRIQGTPITNIRPSLLHLAVSRGDYSLVEHLVQREGFLDCIRTEVDEFSDVIHECVRDTVKLNSRAILSKLDIIKCFAKLDNDLMLRKNKKVDSPILAHDIHFDLAKELLALTKFGYEIFHIAKFLHNSVKTCNCDEFYIVVKYILDEMGSEYFASLCSEKVDGDYLMHTLFQHWEPDEKLLNLCKSAAVLIGNDNIKRKSVLQFAIEKQMSLWCITWLLENVSFNKRQLKRAFVLSVRKANLIAFTALLNGNYVEVNTKTSDGDNVLQVICRSTTKYHPNHSEIARKLIQCGLSPFDEDWKNVALVDNLFSTLKPAGDLSQLVESIRSVASTDADKNELLQAAARYLRCPTSCKWLLDNGNFNETKLKDAYIESVRYANLNVVTSLLDGKYVEANIETSYNENMLQVLFSSRIISCEDHYNVAKLLSIHGASLNNENISSENLFDQLIIAKTPNSNAWWRLFDFLFDQIQTRMADFHFQKACLLIRRAPYHSKTSLDKTLLDGLRGCIDDLNNISQKDENGDTLLHLVWLHGFPSNIYSVEIWKMLVDVGADLLALNNQNETPVCILMSKRYFDGEKCLEVFMYVVNKIPITETEKINNLTVLVVREDAIEMIKKICEWYTSIINKPINSIRGYYKGEAVTMLDMALLSCDGDVLEYLLKTHECKKALHPFGKTWIHTCVETHPERESALKFITLVNELYPDLVNTPNEGGLVPLSMMICDSKYVKHLVQLGANVNAVDVLGNTPLHWAIKNNQYKSVIGALLECGAEVNAVTVDLETPLLLTINYFYSLWYPNADIFKLLIDSNADPRIKDSKGNTVLHILSQKWNVDDFCKIADILVQKGYSNEFKIPGENGLTPLQIASDRFEGHPTVMELLQKFV